MKKEIETARRNAERLCRATDTTQDDWSCTTDQDVYFDFGDCEIAPELVGGVSYECKLVGKCRSHDRVVVVENDFSRREIEIRELIFNFYFRELGKKSDIYSFKITCWKDVYGKFRLPEVAKALHKALQSNSKGCFEGVFNLESYEYEDSIGKIHKGTNITLVNVQAVDEDTAERL